ncbi:MAG: Ni/Fe hydrogenase subunit alpha [Candidatus Zixiibacteriota bacterium]|nr:MAG: Ni/Fe hydrogenase subunit alpha [candidate division Zixibacteria bacterium]
MKGNRIKVDYLARVEGEGGINIKIKNKKVSEVQLRIFEPPRFFEAFLRGRQYSEAPDITARICGICPVAYQMSSSHAMENAIGIKVDGQLRELRRLLYCGEWIESHVLHIFMLHAPDFLGYEDVIQMSKDHPETVKKALELKKLGNDIMILLGGREIHPINVRVGGFYKVPEKVELLPFLERLKRASDEMGELIKLLSTFEYPELERDYEFVSLKHPDEYPLCEGRLVSNKGLDIPIQDYEKHFIEEHIEHSTSLHSYINERGEYLVGPLARFNNCYDELSPGAKDIAAAIDFKPVCKNQFKSLLARGIEVMFAFEEAMRIIQNYEKPEKPFLETKPVEAVGMGCSEAPRGVLYHRYKIDSEGFIKEAKTVPPTSQNQKSIESDLKEFTEMNIDLPDDTLQWKCEQTVRNYDPCISCSVHALKIGMKRD